MESANCKEKLKIRRRHKTQSKRIHIDSIQRRIDSINFSISPDFRLNCTAMRDRPSCLFFCFQRSCCHDPSLELSFSSRRVALLHLCPVPLEFRLNGDVTFYLSQDRNLAEVEHVQLTKFRAAPCRRKITAINRKTVFISRFLSFTTVHIDRPKRKARTARQFHSPTGYFHRQRPRRFSNLPLGLHVN